MAKIFPLCVACTDAGEGREQDAASFACTDAGEGREQDAASFACTDAGEGREQGATSFVNLAGSPLPAAFFALSYQLHIYGD